MDNKQSNQVVEVEGKAKQVLAKHKNTNNWPKWEAWSTGPEMMMFKMKVI